MTQTYTEINGKPLFKVVYPDGSPTVAETDFRWPLPGKWAKIDPEIELEMCHVGFHLTTKPYGKWYVWGADVYSAEGRGFAGTEGDKSLFREARLLELQPRPGWLAAAYKFVEEEIPAVNWFQPDGNPDLAWKLFPTRGAAWDAAWDAARGAAGYAAGYAAGNAAWDASLKVRINCICADLEIDQKHRDHAAARWNVWRKGYGLLCDIDGILYVYEEV